MTEKQIEQLKKVLSDSTLADNSAELDSHILKSAHKTAQENRAKLKAESGPRSIATLIPVSFLRSASLAIVFTLGVFFAMGQLISPDENIAAHDDFDVKINDVASNGVINPQGHSAIVRPERLALEPAPSRLARDQILMRFELSNTEEMLAKLSSDFSADDRSSLRDLDVAAVQVAMIDISSLIQIGELDDARQRYNSLKTECDGCGGLPQTLEALVIAVQAFASKSNDSGTG